MEMNFSKTRKIKRFKVNLRPRETFRKLRQQMDTLSLARVQWLELIKEEAEKVSALINPSIIYDTWKTNAAREVLISSHQELGKQILMVSFLAASIGDRFSRELIENKEESRQKIWPALGEEALEQTINFALKLINQEAKKDSCQLLPPVAVKNPQELENIIESLSAEKINVRIEDNKIFPFYTAISFIPWVPQGKSYR